MFARYGPIGWLAEDRDDLLRLVGALDRSEFVRNHPRWIANLKAIREARRPERLATSYAASIDMTAEFSRDGSLG